MTAPAHGGQLRAIAARFSLPEASLLDFSANINPEGPPPAVNEAIRQALLEPGTLTQYPDLEEVTLRAAIGRYAGASSSSVTVSNGFVPLLEAALRARQVHRCLVPVPCFTEYRRTLLLAGVERISFRLPADFAYAPDVLLDRAQATGSNAILLANPQNPTGLLAPRATLLSLVEAAKAQNVFIFLDEAFIDYIPSESLTALTDAYPNLLVFRSVTKFHAIPGLRVAYAVSSGATRLRGQLAPWAISTLAALGASAALADLPYATQTRQLNLDRRSTLQTGLRELGIRFLDGAANFLLLAFPEASDVPAVWERLIHEHGINTRLCLDYENLSPDHLRIAIRNEADNARLLAALRDVRNPHR